MTKSYKIIMMNKQEIRIDSEEIPKLLKAISTGSPVVLKQGIINPSSYSHIIEDTSRTYHETQYNELGHNIGSKVFFKELPDIFAEIEEIARLKSADIKRLGSN